ncbi:hypothetical protein HQ563_02115 [bacterium]|nr:hypothetical protein [bacterium]
MPTVSGNDGSGSTLDADSLDGTDSSGFAAATRTHNADDIASGNLDNAGFSAYDDLSAEGYLDNDADADLLTRTQADGRYWTTRGNRGTVGSAHFVGTTDAAALEFRVANQRALRIEPVDVMGLSPNLIGGCRDNKVTSGVKGATIGGGGSSSFRLRLPDFFNTVKDSYGTVSGGFNNHAGDGLGSTVDNVYATVGGGAHNRATGLSATVGGGGIRRIRRSRHRRSALRVGR